MISRPRKMTMRSLASPMITAPVAEASMSDVELRPHRPLPPHPPVAHQGGHDHRGRDQHRDEGAEPVLDDGPGDGDVGAAVRHLEPLHERQRQRRQADHDGQGGGRGVVHGTAQQRDDGQHHHGPAQQDDLGQDREIGDLGQLERRLEDGGGGDEVDHDSLPRNDSTTDPERPVAGAGTAPAVTAWAVTAWAVTAWARPPPPSLPVSMPPGARPPVRRDGTGGSGHRRRAATLRPAGGHRRLPLRRGLLDVADEKVHRRRDPVEHRLRVDAEEAR